MSSSDDYFLFFSRLVPAKGILDAITAANQLQQKLIVGGGPPLFEDDVAFIKQYVEPHFSTTVQYEGSPDDSRRLALYQHAKALLFPTQLDEQFGLAAAEAMSCGTPVIAYNRGALAEVVEDGVTGFIVDPDNEDRPGKGSWVIKKQGIEGLVEAMKRIDEIDRVACRKRVEEKFTVERMVKEYIHLYERMLNK